MGFSLPWLLLLGIGALGPVVAHLLRKRELPISQLPTVLFLRRAVAKSQSKVRISDWVLLLIRILAVLALVVAASGPYRTQILAYGDGSPVSLALVIDDSMSMSARVGQGSILDAAKERALKVIGSLEEGSEVSVTLGGHPPRVVVPPTEELSAAADWIEQNLRESARRTELGLAIERAQQLPRKPHGQARVLVLTDETAEAERSLGDRAQSHRVSIERFGAGSPTANLAIDEVLTAVDPTRSGELSVRITAIADREEGSSRAAVELELDGGETRSALLSLTEGRGEVTLHIPASGSNTLGIALSPNEGPDEDALSADNRRVVLLGAGAEVRCLFVDGGASSSRDSGDARFFRTALEAAGEQGAGIALRVVDGAGFDAGSLQDTDVLVLANAPAPSLGTAERIASFVRAGGGLFLAAGDQASAAAYRSRLGDLLGVRLGEPVSSGSASAPQANVRVVESSEVLHGSPHGFERASVRRQWVLTNQDAATFVHAHSQGAPLLVSRPEGEGNVMVLATSLNDAWGSLPLEPGYVPFVVRAVTFLAYRPLMSAPELEAGEAVELRRGRPLTIVGPGGERHAVEGSEDQSRSFRGTGEAGLYQVEDERGGAVASFVVRPSLTESDLSGTSSAALEGETEAAGSEEGIEEGGTAETRTRKIPFGHWVFLLAGFLLALEGWLRLTTRGRGILRA